MLSRLQWQSAITMPFWFQVREIRVARVACDILLTGTRYNLKNISCCRGKENLIIYSDGDDVVVTTVKRPVRFLLVSGKPLGEPVAWYGPIVMNTREELKTAFKEYENGTFVKHGK